DFAFFHRNRRESEKKTKTKTIISSETMDILDGINIKVKAKQIEIEGPREKLAKNFNSRKTTASICTALSHVKNLITGVTKGYWYNMRFVYAHFSINTSVAGGTKSIEIRNFLCEKKMRKVDTIDGVMVVRFGKVKDELVLDDNDIKLVS
ncbi:60S ribosomal protein L9, partial [Datura stramonium]|nr:60S ribosomal protein L9 [Datura stramonium]